MKELGLDDVKDLYSLPGLTVYNNMLLHTKMTYPTTLVGEESCVICPLAN